MESLVQTWLLMRKIQMNVISIERKQTLMHDPNRPKSSLALLALHLIQGSQDRLTLQKVKVCAASSAFIRSDMKYSKDVFAHHEKSPPASHAYSAGKSWPKTSRLWQQWSSWRQFNFKVWRCVRLQTLELGGELSWWLSRSLTSKLDDAAAQQFGNLSLENQSRV